MVRSELPGHVKDIFGSNTSDYDMVVNAFLFDKTAIRESLLTILFIMTSLFFSIVHVASCHRLKSYDHTTYHMTSCHKNRTAKHYITIVYWHVKSLRHP